MRSLQVLEDYVTFEGLLLGFGIITIWKGSLCWFRSCKSDLQCLKSSLGKLSRCSPENGLCECYDWDSQDRAATICFNEKCYLKKHLEDFCSEDEECQAGVHVDAVCVKHPNFLPHETVCMCPEGRSCKNLGDNCESNRECEDGVSHNAICSIHIGEFVCVCPEGKVCVKEMREYSGNLGTLEIVGIVAGVLGAIAIISVVVVLVLRCRKTDYFV
ncbi:unnamed protein product [Allacma fusca]|uniref:Uncharacterized protein n=1 Tax=Allacma fusca TaxID=39272 RepID=A0A8J2LQ78_9HEXA|nr:unnamed protein product [Allacma fusca]